ncbi:MAG TPA: C25 family cysteine peptidase, partial [Candidatus Syntrophosphaera sp.]|nr:C25 family cysteine peptidase [Candidatus Syntrophosphaera sp.]
MYVTPFHTQDGNLVVSDHITIDLLSLTPAQRLSPASPRPKLNPYFIDIYRHHFINFECRYEDIAEYGSMAVICPTGSDDIQLQQFRGLIQPWVEWKNQKGIPTTVYSTDVTGDSYAEIRDFIQNLYESDPQLTFVQLVGDYDQLPCQVATISGNTGGMDAFYSLLEGDDYYPDIFVGRFSAEIAAELYTQIQRSIEYEKGTTSGDWLSRAAGVCSNNPPLPGDDDEHNWEHLDKIRAQLLAYGYTQVDRIYANEGAGAQELINCLNSGQSLVNYCGEGYATHWVAPEFWNSDASNLSNTNMLPFIHVVSCWTGQFYNGTCLAEALMRSRDATSEQARGAIAVYAAAPEQGIAPPMEAQDHAMALLVSGTKNTIGGLCYNGSCSMIAAYGEGGVYNFLAWNLFGDASLVLRTQPATQIAAVLPD